MLVKILKDALPLFPLASYWSVKRLALNNFSNTHNISNLIESVLLTFIPITFLLTQQVKQSAHNKAFYPPNALFLQHLDR